MPNSYNSIHTGGQHDTYVLKQDLIDLIYPIGAVYISVSNTNPSTLFGGTWEQIQDKFLLCAGSTYEAGSTGGAATTEHTHTMEHTHNEGNLRAAIGASGNNANTLSYVAVERHERGPATVGAYTVVGSSHQTTTRTFNHYTQVYGLTGNASNNTTSNSNLNNMPPYLSVYVWKRTA